MSANDQNTEMEPEMKRDSQQRMARRLTLPADFARCLGGGCENANECQRYRARNEDWPNLSYIQGGAFVDGSCICRIEPPSDQALRSAPPADVERKETHE